MAALALLPALGACAGLTWARPTGFGHPKAGGVHLVVGTLVFPVSSFDVFVLGSFVILLNWWFG